jgi:hypothetical protein
MLSQEAILEFQQIYKKNFGEDLPEKIVLERAMSFLEFFKTIFKPLPIPEKNYEKK